MPPQAVCKRCHKIRLLTNRQICRPCYSYIQSHGKLAMFPYTTGRFYRKWTQEEKERAVILRAAGRTYDEIAVALNRTIASIQERLLRMVNKANGKPEQKNYKKKPQPIYNHRKEAEELDKLVAEQMANLPDWWNEDRAAYTDWDDYDTGVLRKLVAEGMPLDAIAKRLCRPQSSVYGKARKLGIVSRKRKTGAGRPKLKEDRHKVRKNATA